MENSSFREGMIYFENIKYGLDHYNNEVVVMNETEALAFFAKKLEEAEKGSVYADFYYGILESINVSSISL